MNFLSDDADDDDDDDDLDILGALAGTSNKDTLIFDFILSFNI